MAPSPNPEEAAAIAAAVERFAADTAPPAGEEREAVGPWQRAALIEGAGAKGAVQNHLEGGAKWLS
jgi:hypothetical protein